jgi:hypothetical protein
MKSRPPGGFLIERFKRGNLSPAIFPAGAWIVGGLHRTARTSAGIRIAAIEPLRVRGARRVIMIPAVMTPMVTMTRLRHGRNGSECQHTGAGENDLFHMIGPPQVAGVNGAKAIPFPARAAWTSGAGDEQCVRLQIVLHKPEPGDE